MKRELLIILLISSLICAGIPTMGAYALNEIPQTVDEPDGSEEEMIDGQEKSAIREGGDAIETEASQESESVETEMPEESESPETEMPEESESTETEMPEEPEGLESLVAVKVSEGWYSICPAGAPNQCLDVKNYSDDDGAVVQLYQMKKNLAQRFYIYESGEEGWYKIQNISSGKILGAASGESGASVLQWTDDDTDGQFVKFYKDPKGYLLIASRYGDDLVYTVTDEEMANGTSIELAEYEDAVTQKFVFSECEVPGKETAIPEGIYKICLSAYGDMVMDVKSGSTSSGANVQLYESNGTGAQEWQITRQGSWYTIANVKSGNVLDISGGSEKEGANIQQYTSNGSKAQLFRFYDAGNGQYYIMSKMGTVINSVNGGRVNGTNIQMDYWKDSAAQQWGLEEVLILSSTEKKVTEGYYTIQNVSNDRLLSAEDQNTVSGGNISVDSENSAILTQTYQLERQSDGWYLIRNVRSSKYLQVTDGSKKEGTNLQQYNRNEEDAQKFKFYDAGNGRYYIKSKLQTVIEAVEGNAVMNKATGEKTQQWVLKGADILSEASEITVEAGDYILCSALDSNMVMDVKSGSKSSGANIQIYTENGTNAQNFYIERTSDGWYTIQNNRSKMYVDVSGGSTKAGANLQQYTGNGTDAQKFKFYDAGDGKVIIKSKKGTVIDISGAGKSSGTNVQMYSYNGTNAQKWILKASLRQRAYQNPSQYYQIQDSISLSGGGYNLSVGYEGLKTAWVIRKLGLGDAIGMGGAYYSDSVASKVEAFQKKNGLPQTGEVNLATWKAMGYTESQWYSLGAYVSPIRVDRDSTKEDCIEAMISRAYDYLDDDYVIGASGAPGLGCDCSGLVMQALYAAGIDMETITPVTHAQPGHEYESRNIWNSSKFKHVSYSSRQRGDLIVYCNSNGVVNHIAIYLGNDRVIESYPDKVITSHITSSLHTHVKGVIRPFV